MKKIIIIFSAGAFLFTFGLVCFYIDLVSYAEKPFGDFNTKNTIIISAGQSLSGISERLHQAGIINHPVKFNLFARIKGYDKKIKAGEYVLAPVISPGKILKIFVSGKVLLHRITIPEGCNLRQIASIFAKAGFGAENKFIKLANDPYFVHKTGVKAQTLEGYLFPDTYSFPKDATPEKILSTMVKRFWFVFNDTWKKQAKKIEFSIHQAVTLASIIEKETGASFERPIISSVFHNRLKKKMRLESDPTVIYAIKDFKGNIKRKHLVTETPYNTYKIKGLPPGPIANPGRKAIEAALFPADTQYLYFVSKRDNTHKFSTNLESHSKAVRKYQLFRARTP